MNYTTSSSNAPKAFTITDIENAKKLIDSVQASTDWMLVAPDGRVWKGPPEQLLNVLMPHHPILKQFSFGELK